MSRDSAGFRADAGPAIGEIAVETMRINAEKRRARPRWSATKVGFLKGQSAIAIARLRGKERNLIGEHCGEATRFAGRV